jgi:head-tail adaptor
VINAGDLIHYVDYQTPTETADSYGQLTTTWATSWSDYALVKPLRGYEAQAARQTRADASHLVDIRGPVSVSVLGRFLWTDSNGTSRTLNVAEVPKDLDGNGNHLRITCAEFVAS